MSELSVNLLNRMSIRRLIVLILRSVYFTQYYHAQTNNAVPCVFFSY